MDERWKLYWGAMVMADIDMVPDSSVFQGNDGTHSLTATVADTPGLLFPSPGALVHYLDSLHEIPQSSKRTKPTQRKKAVSKQRARRAKQPYYG